MQPETLALLDADRRGLLASVERSVGGRPRAPARRQPLVGGGNPGTSRERRAVGGEVDRHSRARTGSTESAAAGADGRRANGADSACAGGASIVPDALRPKGTMTAAAAIEALAVRPCGAARCRPSGRSRGARNSARITTP